MGKGIGKGKLKTTVLLLSLLLISVVHADAASREVELFDRGYEYYLSYQPEKAAETLRQFLKEFPGSPSRDAALFWLGKSLLQLKSPGEARMAFLEIKERFPESPFMSHVERELEATGAGGTGRVETSPTRTEGPPGGERGEVQQELESTGRLLSEARAERDKLSLLLEEERRKSDTLDKSHTALQQKLADAEQRVNPRERELSEAVGDRDRLSSLLEQEKRTSEEQRLRIADLERKAVERQDLPGEAEAKDLLPRRLAETEQRLSVAEHALSETGEEKEKLNRILGEERIRIEELRSRITDLEKREAESKGTMVTAEAYAALERKYSDLAQRTDSLEKSLAETTEARNSALARLDEEEKKTNEMRERVVELEGRESEFRGSLEKAQLNDTLQRRLSDLEERTLRTDKALSLATEERDRLTATLGEERRAAQVLKDRVADLEQQQAVSRRDEEGENSRTSLQERLAEAQEKANRTEMALSQATDERGRLSSLLEQEKKISEEQRSKITDLEQRGTERRNPTGEAEATDVLLRRLTESERRASLSEEALLRADEERGVLERRLQEEKGAAEHLRARVAELEKKGSQPPNTSQSARGQTPLEEWLATVEQKADVAEKALARALVERDRLASLLKEEKKQTEALRGKIADIEKGEVEMKGLGDSAQTDDAPERKLAEMDKRIRRAERSLAKTRTERDRLEALLDEERDKTEQLRARIAEIEKREIEPRGPRR